MTNERKWQSLVNFLSGLGGTDPVSMIHETPRYFGVVEEYLKTDESRKDVEKTSFYLGVFLGEYLNQKHSGYWKHDENESLVLIGPDEDGLIYKTSPTNIQIEKGSEQPTLAINPFLLARDFLAQTVDQELLAYVNSRLQPKA